jgi:hypothetical protein
MKTVSKQTSSIIAAAVAKKLAADKSTSLVVDSLQADGVTIEMMTAPKGKDADRTFYASLESAVVAGFTATAQGLLKKETKTLTDQQKSDKRYWQQQIGSKIKDFRNALQRRLNQGEEGEGGAGNTSTLEARIKRDLTKYVAQLEKVEQFSGNVVELVKCLKSALVYVK